MSVCVKESQIKKRQIGQHGPSLLKMVLHGWPTDYLKKKRRRKKLKN